MTGTFIIFVAIEFVLVMIYARQLAELVDYSRAHDLAILDRRYPSMMHLYSDFHFFNRLFSGEAVEWVQDQGLSERLKRLRTLLMLQLLFGAMLFCVGIIAGATA